jgi:hypothetical protein
MEIFRLARAVAGLAAATCVLACSAGSSPAQGGDGVDGGADDSSADAFVPTYAPTFTAIYEEILAPTCAGTFCHGGTDEAFLPMETQDAAYTAMVGVVSHGPDCGKTGLQIVDPGNPAASLFYLKVTTPPCGSKMPAEYEPYLDDLQTAQIYTWIMHGAPDN